MRDEGGRDDGNTDGSGAHGARAGRSGRARPTLSHEHIFIDLRRTHLPYRRWVIRDDRVVAEFADEDFPATELVRWEAKLGDANLAEARRLEAITDNYLLADEEVAVRELGYFRAAGGGAVMDVTTIGLKRDPLAVRRVSERTGLHIVMGTGWYQRVYHPDDMHLRSVDDLTEVIVREVTEGIHDGRQRTDVRAGIIGEIGINGDPLITAERSSMRAAARAARLTGAPIVIHLGGAGAEKHETLDIVESEGVDLGRVVLGHSDSIATDLPFITGLLRAESSWRSIRSASTPASRTHRWPGRWRPQFPACSTRASRTGSSSRRTSAGRPRFARTAGRATRGSSSSSCRACAPTASPRSAIDAFMVRNPARLLTFGEPAPAG